MSTSCMGGIDPQAPETYEELELRITSGPGGADKIEILRSPYGEAQDRFRWPYPRRDVARLVDAIEGQIVGPTSTLERSEPVCLRQVGERLFRSLSAGALAPGWLQSLGSVEAKARTGLRVRLRLDAQDPAFASLAALPWELLCRPGTGDFLGHDPRLPVVRSIACPRRIVNAAPLGKLRVLVALAAPRNLPPLDLEGELGRLEQATLGAPEVELVPLRQVTLKKLRRALDAEGCHVLHLIGHGGLEEVSGTGGVWLEGPDGGGHSVSGPVLARALKLCEPLRLVCLNGCQTARGSRRQGAWPSVAAALLTAGIPAVVAMQLPISDGAASAFSEAFYQAIAGGRPLEAALGEGRLAICDAAEGTWEWINPVLYLRGDNGHLFTASDGPGGDMQNGNDPRGPHIGGNVNGPVITGGDQRGARFNFGHQTLVEAPDPRDEARQLFDDGCRSYFSGDFLAAIDLFARALERDRTDDEIALYFCLAHLAAAESLAALPPHSADELNSRLGFLTRSSQPPVAALARLALGVLRLDAYKARGRRARGGPSEPLFAQLERSRPAPEALRALSAVSISPTAARRFHLHL